MRKVTESGGSPKVGESESPEVRKIKSTDSEFEVRRIFNIINVELQKSESPKDKSVTVLSLKSEGFLIKLMIDAITLISSSRLQTLVFRTSRLSDFRTPINPPPLRCVR